MVETGGDNGIPGIFFLFPFLIFGLGIVVLFMAFRDERGPKNPARKFVSRADHPLRHVQVALNANRKRAHADAREATRQETAAISGDEAPKPEPPKRKRRPPWLRGV